MKTTFWSRLTAAATVAAGGLFSTGVLSSKTALYIALASGVLQAFQHPVQGNSNATETK